MLILKGQEVNHPAISEGVYGILEKGKMAKNNAFELNTKNGQKGIPINPINPIMRYFPVAIF